VAVPGLRVIREIVQRIKEAVCAELEFVSPFFLDCRCDMGYMVCAYTVCYDACLEIRTIKFSQHQMRVWVKLLGALDIVSRLD
jgi:hypothetical protein